MNFEEFIENITKAGFKRFSPYKNDYIFRSPQVDIFVTEVDLAKEQQVLYKKAICIKYYNHLRKEEGLKHVYTYDQAVNMIYAIFNDNIELAYKDIRTIKAMNRG